jgi:tetratricopeptide (TPR) repeat protein
VIEVDDVEVERIVSRLSGLAAAADELSGMAPMGSQFLTRIGRAYTLLGAHDRAEPFLRRAVEANPLDGGAHYGLGAAYVFLGRFDDARRHLTEAVRLAPGHFPAWYSLVDLDRQTAESNHIQRLEALFEGPDADGLRTLHAGHALAKTYEDLGDYDTAFDWLLKAKTVRRARANYLAAREDALFSAAAQSADAGKGRGADSDRPIFIVGMPRTGTTLIESILAAHPEVNAGGELAIFGALVKQLSGGSKRELLDPQNLTDAAEIDLDRLGRAYIEATGPIATSAARFTDKTPINVIYAGLIHRALPNARIVCLRRNPMDSVVAFFRMMFFAWPHIYPSVYDLESAAHHYVRFHRLADRWREILPADRYREVRYEALVADQEAETRRLLEFAGLEFDPATLDFHRRAGVVSTASAVQVRRPIYTSSMGRWRRYGERLAPAVRILEAAGIVTD